MTTPEMPDLCPLHARRWAEHLKKSPSYESFIKTYDIKPAKGNTSRFKGLKSGRVHHLLSDLEKCVFHILDASPTVMEIKENFPCDPQKSWELAHELGVKHHACDEGLVVPTVDFLLTVVDSEGKQGLMARDVKPANKLNERWILDNLNLVKEYYERDGIDYKIYTENEIHYDLANNISLMRDKVDLEEHGITEHQISAAQSWMYLRISNAKSVSSLAIECDRALGFELGSSIVMIQHLIITRQWYYDLRIKFDPSSIVTCQQIVIPKKHLEEACNDNRRTVA